MANWNYGGYTAPASVTSKDDVRELQRQLGVKADGLWGPETQAAYDASMGNATSSIPSNYSSYLKDALSMIKESTPTVSYTPMSREEIQADLTAALRPGYDLAIANRKKQTATNKANIDADAAARGMGASTWVTDVKDRQQDAEADDIATMESNYIATIAQQLMSALQAERANQMAADQFNANSQANALSAALGLAGQFYGNDLAMAQKATRGGGSGGSSKSKDEEDLAYAEALSAALGATGASAGLAETGVDWTSLLKDANPEERREILYGTTEQGKSYMNQLVSELGESALGRYRRYYG